MTQMYGVRERGIKHAPGFLVRSTGRVELPLSEMGLAV